MADQDQNTQETLADIHSNDILGELRDKVQTSYEHCAHNMYSFLNSSVEYTDQILTMIVEMAEAKAKLIQDGVDIFAVTPEPVPTVVAYDDNSSATAAAEAMATSGSYGGVPQNTNSVSQASNYNTANYTGPAGNGDVDPAKVYQIIRGFGYNKIAACGIMGNIEQESSFDTTARNSYGYMGLCQWDPDGRWPALVEYARKNGWDPYDAGAQLNFMYYEATNTRYPDACSPENMNTMATPEDAAMEWLQWFEGALGQEESNRKKYARKYYDTFQ